MIVYDSRNEMVASILKQGYVGAEFGVLVGEFSEILYSYGPSRLDLVDLWDFATPSISGDKDGNNGVMYDMRVCYDTVCSKFKDKPNVYISKNYASDYLKCVDDEFYDFVYLDTNHLYEYTILELNRIFPKVKYGGFICGHDFDTSDKCKSVYNFGVDRAVYEFCYTHNQKIHSYAMDGCVSFAIQKR